MAPPPVARNSRATVAREELVNETPGRLRSAQIRSFVSAHEGTLRPCYERQARTDPTFQGGLVLSWEVLPDGSVSAPMTSRSTLEDAEIEDCVLRQVRRWRFPESDSQTTVVSIPLHFPPQASAPSKRGPRRAGLEPRGGLSAIGAEDPRFSSTIRLSVVRSTIAEGTPGRLENRRFSRGSPRPHENA